jgi:hypothetical protein
MTTLEKINKSVKKLSKSSQIEVLHYIEYLLSKSGQTTEEYYIGEWNKFSLNQAMTGLEDDGLPEFCVSDLKEKFY